MNKAWLPITAGTLDILSGSFQLAFFAYITYGIIYQQLMTVGENVGSILLRFIFIITAHLAITGIFAILGGIYVLKKKRWNLVYVGAVTASIPLVFLSFVLSMEIHPVYAPISLVGIAALVLSLRVEKEFRQDI